MMRVRYRKRMMRHRNKAEKMRRIAARFLHRGMVSIGLSYILMSESYERRADFWKYHR